MTDQEAIDDVEAMQVETDVVIAEVADAYTSFQAAYDALESAQSSVTARLASMDKYVRYYNTNYGA